MKIGFVLLGLAGFLMIWPMISEWVLYDKQTRQTRQRRQRLIDRANRGDRAAIEACDNDGLINKRMYFSDDDDGLNVRCWYSLPARWL